MSFEECPFCGKPFKRLKAHLPHCKMSPESKTSEITKKPKEIQTSTSKHTSNRTNKVNSGTALKCTTSQAVSKSPVKSRSKKVENMNVGKETSQNAVTLTSTASQNPSTGGRNTDTLKPKTTWISKREQEMLKRSKLQTHESVPQQEKDTKNPVRTTRSSEKEIDNELKQLGGTGLTSQLTTTKNKLTASGPFQTVSRTTDCQIKQSILKCQENANVSGSIRNSLMTEGNTSSVSSRLKEKGVSVLKAKTCVWDHINHGLYKTRHDCVPVLSSVVSTHMSFTKCVNTPESVLKPITGNTIMKTSSVQFPIFQTSHKRPFKDSLSPRVQNVPVMAYSPEMATGYGGLFLFSHSEISSSNENLLTNSQPSKPSSMIQGVMTETRLGDVRLNELASWLVARTPKSPNEAVTMFNRGWQWYYRKYIDVQKGGIGGIAMLIGSYCVLSYTWSYSHIKKDRWRKYH